MDIIFDIKQNLTGHQQEKLIKLKKTLNEINSSNLYEVIGRITCFFNFQVFTCHTQVWIGDGEISILLLRHFSESDAKPDLELYDDNIYILGQISIYL